MVSEAIPRSQPGHAAPQDKPEFSAGTRKKIAPSPGRNADEQRSCDAKSG